MPSPRGRVGEYQLQAAIAAIHDRAPMRPHTDWPQILALYGLLEQMYGKPRRDPQPRGRGGHGRTPDAGLAILDGVDAGSPETTAWTRSAGICSR